MGSVRRHRLLPRFSCTARCHFLVFVHVSFYVSEEEHPNLMFRTKSPTKSDKPTLNAKIEKYVHDVFVIVSREICTRCAFSAGPPTCEIMSSRLHRFFLINTEMQASVRVCEGSCFCCKQLGTRAETDRGAYLRCTPRSTSTLYGRFRESQRMRFHFLFFLHAVFVVILRTS